ncbi:zincin-like metallopeptidase toxin domain-containing protein [Dokdonia sp.]|uniref:zincin-like metallopeptidase toxin domain-containing protein n=1 Tax=Dokdonia sp. TaxID=2024995 RepID=UPI003266ADB7
MNIFDDLNREEVRFLSFPETGNSALDAIAVGPNGRSFPEFPSRFANSRFGASWDTAIYKDDELLEDTSLSVRYVVTVSDTARNIKVKFENEVVPDDVIKLYLVVGDKRPIDYNKPEKEDLRLANIRYSNLVEIVGFVIGDDVVKAIEDDSRLYQEYVDKFVRSFTESTSDVSALRKALSDAFTHYLENPRSNFFKRSFIGDLIKKELIKDLQEFWKPILSSLAREIRTLKIEDEKYWQPYTASGDLKSDAKYTPIFPVAEASQEVGLFFNGVIKQFEVFDTVISDYLNINTLKGKPDVIVFKDTTKNTILINIFREVYDFFKGIINFVKEGLENFIASFIDSGFTLNAFFVGVYNGVIHFIASLVDIISFFAGFLSGDSEQVFEAVRKEFEKLKEVGFFSYIYAQLAKFFEKISKRYDSSQAKYVITKNLGEDIFKVFETIITIYAGVQVVKRAARGIKGLRKQVDDTIELSSRNIDDLFTRTSDDIDELFRNKKSNKDGGILLTRSELLKFKRDIQLRYKNLGLKVEVVRNVPRFKKRLKRWNLDNTQGSFNPGPPPIMFLRPKSTQLTVQHEVWHLEDLDRLGIEQYKRTPNWSHEESVWFKILKNKSKWTKQELIDSYDYYKKTVWRAGGNPIINQDIEDIIKKK